MTNPRGAWRLLCEVPNKMEALFIQGRLQSEGIPVHIVSEAAAELYGITQGDLAAARLFVPSQHWEAARQLLEEDPPDPPDPSDPPDGDGTPNDPEL